MHILYDYCAAEEEQHLIVVLRKNKVSLKWKEHDICLKKSRGVQYLVELLLHPYQSISAVALHALVNHEPPLFRAAEEVGLQSAQVCDFFHNLLPAPLADPQTIQSIKQRLNLLICQIAEAESWSDMGRLEELKLERDSLIDYLKDAISQQRSGQVYRDADYKCADTVYHSLDYVLRILARECEPLGTMLRECLHLWSDLLFIPADKLSVIVMEND